MEKSKLTIGDIAKISGVSKSTVSRVINGDSNVSLKTRKRVQKVISETRFVANSFAQGLRTNKKKQIVLAIDDISNPYYPELAKSAEEVAKEYGFRLVLFNHHGNPQEELSVVECVDELHVDGVILVPIGLHPNLKNAVKNSSVPISVIGKLDDIGIADEVCLSKEEGLLAMEHLINLGCTSIAYVGGPKDSHRGRRYQAYESSLLQNFTDIEPSLVFFGDDFSIQTGIKAAEYLLTLPNLPEGVFAGNDMIAIGLMRELMKKGVRVPEDVAVAGVDDISWCKITSPMLTSVSNMKVEAGRMATQLLCERIVAEEFVDFQRIFLEPKLIVRESTTRISQALPEIRSK